MSITDQFKGFWPFEVRRLSDESGKLSLDLLDESDNAITVTFDHYLVYRKIDEGNALKSLPTLKAAVDRRIWIYNVPDSAFLEWFYEESYDIRRGEDLKHYAVITSNDIVDVISPSPPTCKITQ